MYIHYGHNEYSRNLLISGREKKHPTENLGWKPNGLWASPVDAEWGWKDWCESEEYYTEELEEHFEFTLSPKARILHLHSLDDAEPYITGDYLSNKLNLDKIYRLFDGMELHISDDYCRFRSNNVFYTWDVDSICVWNPDVIQIEGRMKHDKERIH